MRVNNDLGIFDFDDFAMEMTSTELLLVNGGACGGGYTGSGSSYTSSGCGGGNVPSITDRITTSIEQNLDKKYNKNEDGYMCDNWVQEVLTDAGLDYNDYFAGDAYRKEVKDHIADLKSKGTGNYTSKIPSKAGVYVVFMDGTGSLGTLDPHCGILVVNSNGTMDFTHNSSSNTAAGVGGGVWTDQTYSQNNGTKLSGLAYSNFYFQEIKL